MIRKHSVTRLTQLTLLVAAAIAFTLYLWGPLRDARWDIIDDHEIASFVGPDGRLPLAAVPGKAIHESGVDLIQRLRFRPIYYLLRVVESSLWGLQPSRWFRAHQVLFASTLFITLLLAALALGPLAAILGAGWVLTQPYWADVWARLGPSESYAALGLALWGLGLFLLWRPRSDDDDGRMVRMGAVALLVGFVLASGAKENLLVLALPMFVLLATEVRAGRARGFRVRIVLVGLCWALLVAGPITLRLAFAGVDAYHQPVSPHVRSAVFLQSLGRATPLHYATAVSLALWVVAWRVARRRTGDTARAWRALASKLVGASLLLLALYLSQDVFYNGALPTGMRYDFPALLAWPIWLAVAMVSVRRFLEQCGFPGLARASWHGAWIVLLALLVSNGAGLLGNRAAAAGIASRTRQFTARLMDLVAAARRDPARPIVVTSHDPMDFEPIWSLQQFLRAYRVTNPRFLYLAWDKERRPTSALALRLAEDIPRLVDERILDFEPIDRFRPDRPCLSVGLSGEPLGVCEGLGRLF